MTRRFIYERPNLDSERARLDGERVGGLAPPDRLGGGWDCYGLPGAVVETVETR